MRHGACAEPHPVSADTMLARFALLCDMVTGLLERQACLSGLTTGRTRNHNRIDQLLILLTTRDVAKKNRVGGGFNGVSIDFGRIFMHFKTYNRNGFILGGLDFGPDVHVPGHIIFLSRLYTGLKRLRLDYTRV